MNTIFTIVISVADYEEAKKRYETWAKETGCVSAGDFALLPFQRAVAEATGITFPPNSPEEPLRLGGRTLEELPVQYHPRSGKFDTERILYRICERDEIIRVDNTNRQLLNWIVGQRETPPEPIEFEIELVPA